MEFTIRHLEMHYWSTGEESGNRAIDLGASCIDVERAVDGAFGDTCAEQEGNRRMKSLRLDREE